MLNSAKREFQLLIESKIHVLKNNESCLKHSDGVFILLINVQMPTVVILTFMSRINFMLSWVEHVKSFFHSYTPANFVCLYPPRKLCLWWVYCFDVVRASISMSIRPSVTFCFLNILKSHCWIFIKPCKHVYTCKANTLNKKVRARGQFY